MMDSHVVLLLLILVSRLAPILHIWDIVSFTRASLFAFIFFVVVVLIHEGVLASRAHQSLIPSSSLWRCYDRVLINLLDSRSTHQVSFVHVIEIVEGTFFVVHLGEGALHGRRLCNGRFQELLVNVRHVFNTISLGYVRGCNLFLVEEVPVDIFKPRVLP